MIPPVWSASEEADYFLSDAQAKLLESATDARRRLRAAMQARADAATLARCAERYRAARATFRQSMNLET